MDAFNKINLTYWLHWPASQPRSQTNLRSKTMGIVNSEIKPFKATAFKQSKFVDITRSQR